MKSLKASDATHYELKRFVANNPTWKMDKATDEAIFLFLRDRNHVFSPLKIKNKKYKPKPIHVSDINDFRPKSKTKHQ